MEKNNQTSAADRLYQWAKTHDLDEDEQVADQLISEWNVKKEWAVISLLKVGAAPHWSNTRKMIRALDAEILRIDQEGELRAQTMIGDQPITLKEDLYQSISALAKLHRAERMERLWSGVWQELVTHQNTLEKWIHGERVLALEAWSRSPIRLDPPSWHRSREMVGWLLDALPARIERCEELCSLIEADELERILSPDSIGVEEELTDESRSKRL